MTDPDARDLSDVEASLHTYTHLGILMDVLENMSAILPDDEEMWGLIREMEIVARNLNEGRPDLDNMIRIGATVVEWYRAIEGQALLAEAESFLQGEDDG